MHIDLKKVRVINFLKILAVIIMLSSSFGCGFTYSAINDDYNHMLYPATCFDINAICGRPIFKENYDPHISHYIILKPICLIDLPFSLVTDTFIAPGYLIDRYNEKKSLAETQNYPLNTEQNVVAP